MEKEENRTISQAGEVELLEPDNAKPDIVGATHHRILAPDGSEAIVTAKVHALYPFAFQVMYALEV